MVLKVLVYGYVSYLPICAWKVPLSAMNSEIISLVKNLRLVDSMKSSAYSNRIIITIAVIHHEVPPQSAAHLLQLIRLHDGCCHEVALHLLTNLLK